jgi:large subunit ribosomal protein L18
MQKQSLLRTIRHKRIRTKMSGTEQRPRLSVYRGNQHLYVQVIDDTTGKTLIGLSDSGLKTSGSGIERAKLVATEFTKLLQAKNITRVVFDRGGFKYHGQIKAVADTLRDAGITV